MAGIYIVGIALFVLTIRNLVAGFTGNGATTASRSWLRVVGLIAGLSICVLSVLTARQFPRFSFPSPTGQYAVGTDYLLFSDTTRVGAAEDLGVNGRTISVRVWYPSTGVHGGRSTAYQQDRSAQAIAGMFGMPSFLLGYLTEIPTHSYKKTEPAQADQKYPVVLFSPSGWINHTTAINEELASHGFVVFAVAYAATEPFIYDSSGAIIDLDFDNAYHRQLRRELNSSRVESIKDQIIRCTDGDRKDQLCLQLHQSQPLNVRDIEMRAQDIRFVIDRLGDVNLNLFSGRLDLDRIGVMGFSKGGATAGELCISDARVKAGLNMDGFMYGRIVSEPLKTPFMFMHSVAAVEEAWINDRFYDNTQAVCYMLKIKGSTHSNFGDLSLFDGIFQSRGGLGTIDGPRCVEIQRAYILAFFDKHLRENPSDLLNVESTAYPEVEFVMKSAAEAGSVQLLNSH